MMNIYEEQYQLLKQNGAQAWAGEGYKRAHQQLAVILQELKQRSILPSPGASFLELGCGNGAMSSQYMAERGYEVSGVDISQTAIEWAIERLLTLGLKGNFTQGDVCHLKQLEEEIGNQGLSIIYTDLNHNPWWDHATICCKPSEE